MFSDRDQLDLALLAMQLAGHRRGPFDLGVSASARPAEKKPLADADLMEASMVKALPFGWEAGRGALFTPLAATINAQAWNQCPMWGFQAQPAPWALAWAVRGPG